jgi:hypothetical protein
MPIGALNNEKVLPEFPYVSSSQEGNGLLRIGK